MAGIKLPRKIYSRILILCIILFFFFVYLGAADDTPEPDETDIPEEEYTPDPSSDLPEEEIPLDEEIPPEEEIPETPLPSDKFISNVSDILIPDIASKEGAFFQPYQNSSLLARFDPKSDTIPLKVHSAIGAKIIHDYSDDGVPGLELVTLPEMISVDQAVKYYQSQPGVLYAEPDYFRFSSKIPSDPDFWREWGLENSGQAYRENLSPGKAGSDIGASVAWDTTTGGETMVAVLDSGVDYLHPDLASNIITDPENGTAGYDAITGEMEAMDIASHGTHCAGIIGAVGDDAVGITGVNWRTRILPVRFLNSFGTGTVSDEIKAILWATKQGARIISCSYGGYSYSRAEYEVMKGADALFICAAGNAGGNNDGKPYYPSSHNLTTIISVTATDSSDKLANFSNYGPGSVDLGAPGVDIYSTKHNIYQPVPLWTEPFDNFQNWTKSGNWTLDSGQYGSPNTSVSGTVNRSSINSTQVPAILTLNTPLKISGITNPVLSYQWSLVASNYSFSIEGSANGVSWKSLEYGRGSGVDIPFITRECKIPADLRNGSLFIRFSVDGDSCKLGLDDLTLSDGYGDLIGSRWGYMDGTSMACPQVSGAAALLASANPDASLGDIQKMILTTVRPVPSLSGKTVTGGVLNLSAAMNHITGGSPYHLRLLSGWNHVSVPYRLVSDNDTAGEVFGSLTNVSGHSLYRYEAGDWKTVGPKERVFPLASYWIFTGTPASLPLMVDPNQSGHFSRNLTTGWNGFGLIGEGPLEAKEELKSLSDLWSYVIGFNTTTQISDEPIIRGGSGKQNETRMLDPYQGYWIYLIRNGTFEKNDSQETGEEPEIPPLWPEPLK